ncbi:purine and uridine phosphorylase [Glonium stellatum]|uniref:Purine and uridine phosphorylase n=1 Tax=Glonium stellatum TaxID=574774 RepID=A0A8E2ENM9_9PEZI|nr:purine and uridine phosphorylase [Glonium stellatum]
MPDNPLKRQATGLEQSATTKRSRHDPLDSSYSASELPTDTTAHKQSNSNTIRLTHNDYTVGWICALPIELAASQAMLDEKHQDLSKNEKDSNTYTLGQIGPHNIVLACLPSGSTGTNPAATAATNLLRTFPRIRFGLMVGVGGGAPGNPSDDPDEDLRLGDVVVSNPESTYGGVVQYDLGKTIEGGNFIQTGSLNKPPSVLRSAISKLRAQHELEGTAIPQYCAEMLQSKPAKIVQKYQYQGSKHDQLFQADYNHIGGGKSCENCDQQRLLSRNSRDTTDPVIHYGLIGSANQVIRHAATREKFRQDMGILCLEMEAAGLMDDFPCLVIRGICDYSDTHKNKRWQPYAAATAAAYTKELLKIIPAGEVESIKEAAKIVNLIQREAAAIREDLKPLQDDLQRKEYNTILDWLTPTVFETQYVDSLNKRHQGTGHWFLHSPQFVAWIKGDIQTLFCPGIPGAGKTVIASIAIEHLRLAQTDQGTAVAFLYCNYGKKDEQTAEKLFASLLRQLASHLRSTPESLQALYTSCKKKKTRPSLVEIVDMIIYVSSIYSRVFLVVDALDETSDELQEKTRASIMVTCRPLAILENKFAEDDQLDIRASTTDVESYLDNQLEKLSICTRLRAKEQREILKKLYEILRKVHELYQQHTAAQSRGLKDRQKTTAAGLSASYLGLFMPGDL